VSDLGAVTERQQATWGRGDFHRIGVSQVIVGELLCRHVPVKAGDRVLDVAAGAGNASLAAARRAADVVASDFVESLLETAARRAEVEHLPLTTQVADAQNLPFEDASFDVVLSTFGVMFAPDQEKAASELLRVCRPGGHIGLACWTPDGLIGQQFVTLAQHVPPPAGLKPPILWGTEPHLRGLFGDGAAELRTSIQQADFCNSSALDHVRHMRQWFGPYQTAFESLDEAGQAALEQALVDLLERFNQSGDETLLARSDYLEAIIARA
jgi:ubiquinone/menaquinone biosynthesis C-methylase UbiE